MEELLKKDYWVLEKTADETDSGCPAFTRANRELVAILKEARKKWVEELKDIIPCIEQGCDLRGTIAVQVSDDEWEPQQCQYCYEVRFPIFDRLEAELKALDK